MKIALLTPTFSAFSGIDRLVEIKAKEYLKQGHSVDIYCLAGNMKVKGASVYVIGMPKNPFLERLYRLFMFLDVGTVNSWARALKKYDLVVSHSYPMNILAWKAKKENARLSYRFHNAGVGIVETYSFLERMYLHLFDAFSNKYIRNCDEVVSISKFLSKQLQRETGKKGTVEYIPVDTDRYHPNVSGASVKKKYKLKGPVLLYVGRISPHKGVHLLIDAFHRVRERYSDATLLIVGKPTFPAYSKKLEKMAGKGVIFTGFVSDKDLPSYYAACDVYCTCSLWEGFDMPIVEAFECGKPSVAFSVGSHPEVLEKGKLVKKGDVIGFAEAVMGLVK